MIRQPGVSVSVRPSGLLEASGPLAPRALELARLFLGGVDSEAGKGEKWPILIEVGSAAPEHAGLGTGTQLAMAVGQALCLHLGLPRLDAAALASRMGRGRRSAIGVHGFFSGGFLVEGGKANPGELAPLVARCPFPQDWRVVLVIPKSKPSLHGREEAEVLSRLNIPPETTDKLCRLTLLGMLPAIACEDLKAFGEALYEFNRVVGRCFSAAQGGAYASPLQAEIIEYIRSQGIRGAGQSSWGPSVFAICQDADQAAFMASAVRQKFSMPGEEVVVTTGDNEGAVSEVGKDEG